jgi:hypothetical protein
MLKIFQACISSSLGVYKLTNEAGSAWSLMDEKSANNVDIHGLSGKFPNVQNSLPLRRPSGVWQVHELRCANNIALSCLVIVLCFFM